MRLKKLQISGFKSFVEPTDIRLPADLVAVVGPNGCGKSNVIDAVRWVLGEASAKMLRGDSMTDVIFNGSSARAPVGKAAVELLFDNSDGAAGGAYAKFTEISIKRTLTRDGDSKYFVNRTKARRKDVLDLFRGTGLGPRSYSIIEQGMVGRIIEARPDELRGFVEEAAGTSKYKDRRRETENRMAHTRENLERVGDIRAELEKQLRRLQRQAAAAEKYQALRAEEKLVNGQLLVLRLDAMEEKLQSQQRGAAQCQNNLEAARAALLATESATEKLRHQQTEQQARHNLIQQQYYQLGADMKNLEQRIRHARDTKQLQTDAQLRLQNELTEGERQLGEFQTRRNELTAQAQSYAPRLDELKQQTRVSEANLRRAEQQLTAWQESWEAFNEQSQTPARQQDVQQSRIAQLQQHLRRAAERAAHLEQTLAAAKRAGDDTDLAALRAAVRDHDAACERGEREFARLEKSMHDLQRRLQQMRDHAAADRARLRETHSRLQSLRQMQAAEMQSGAQEIQQWLAEHNLGNPPRLAARIRITDGWERAADRLLHGRLDAFCLAAPPRTFNARPDCEITLITTGGARAGDSASRPRLLDKIDGGGIDLAGFLDGVYIAETLDEALAMQNELRARECVVTRAGELVGANWLNFPSQSRLATGVLARADEIKQLQAAAQQLTARVTAGEAAIADTAAEQDEMRQTAQQQRAELEELRRVKTEMHSNLGREEARHLEQQKRLADIGDELQRLAAHTETDRGEIAAARDLLQRAADARGALNAERDALLQQKEQAQQSIAAARDELGRAREQFHQHQLQQQRVDADLRTVAADLARGEQQIAAARAQLVKLGEVEKHADSAAELESQLQNMLAQRAAAEQKLTAANAQLSALQNRLDEIAAQRAEQTRAVDEAREILQRHDLDKQEIAVRRDTLREQLKTDGHDADELRAAMPAQAAPDEWRRRSEALGEKINRIGAVNLVAIDEFNEAGERKEYLDKQHDDLTAALDTLQQAIRKIDRETKTRFKDTFDRLNAGFNEFFPRLFGGGKAELQLTGDDFLTTGVAVMARPPGKRNSHIHLLSGGEKALTAVALLFALFKLNPAPFCMLDEVDAPLDDANVARYCETLKTLVQAAQMIVITHNKLTMAAADVLVGVTMGEPGVSRLVSVDVERAVKMAAQS